MLVLVHRLSPVTLSVAVRRTVSGLPGLTGQNVKLITNTLSVDQENQSAPAKLQNMHRVEESSAQDPVNNTNLVM